MNNEQSEVIKEALLVIDRNSYALMGDIMIHPWGVEIIPVGSNPSAPIGSLYPWHRIDRIDYRLDFNA